MRAVFARGDAMLQPPACVSVTAQAAHAACLSPRRLQALPKGIAHCAGALARPCNTLHKCCAQLSCSEVVQPRFFAARVAQTRSISVQGCAAVIWTRSRTLDMVMRRVVRN